MRDYRKMATFGNCIDWVVVGVETGSRSGKTKPERKWVESMVEACERSNVPVFIKGSLSKEWREPLIRQLSWKA